MCLYSNVITSQEIRCKLQGRVIGRESKNILLVNEREDPRFDGIKISIVDNLFEYELKSPFIEKYSLIFEDDLRRGSFKPISFFAENCLVEFTLYTENKFEQNSINGGLLTNEMKSFEEKQKQIFQPLFSLYEKEIDTLHSVNNIYSEKTKALTEKIKTSDNTLEKNKLSIQKVKLMDTNEAYTSEYLLLRSKMEFIYKLMVDWQYDYVKTNTDIFSYSLLLSTLQSYNQRKAYLDLVPLKILYPKFAEKYPYHPYTKQIGEMINAINSIKIGSKFIDFSAQTVDGKIIKISEIVNGKVALIDLWSSWCGPCRALNKSIIPVYERFKDKGFVIIGVAGEFENTNAFKKTIATDNYPWLNLVELDNNYGIWNKYNISGSGGCTYLIDPNGTIVAIHLDADELERQLTELLK